MLPERLHGPYNKAVTAVVCKLRSVLHRRNAHAHVCENDFPSIATDKAHLAPNYTNVRSTMQHGYEVATGLEWQTVLLGPSVRGWQHISARHGVSVMVEGAIDSPMDGQHLPGFRLRPF